MNIKLDRFCLLLKGAEEEKNVDQSEISPYLLEHLLYPFLLGKDVRLNDLDYNAFSLSDLDDLFHHVSDMETACNKIQNKTQRLFKSDPAVRPTRAFC